MPPGWPARLLSLPISLAIGLAPAKALIVALPAGLAGALWLVVPWDSLAPRWLHAPSLLGSLAVAIAVAAAGESGGAYAWLAIGVLIYAALAVGDRGALAFEVGCALALLAVACLAGSNGAGAAVWLGAAPALIVVAALTFGQRERLQLHSRHDPLTGVGNYRGLRERLRYEIVRHERHRRSFTVMLLDLDRFKLVNDRYGHLEGDRLLRAVGRALTKVVRDQDTVARQGGDEFSVLLPETGDHGAEIVAAKIGDSLARDRACRHARAGIDRLGRVPAGRPLGRDAAGRRRRAPARSQALTPARRLAAAARRAAGRADRGLAGSPARLLG